MSSKVFAGKQTDLYAKRTVLETLIDIWTFMEAEICIRCNLPSLTLACELQHSVHEMDKKKKNSYFEELFEEKRTFHLATTAPLKEEREGLQFTKNTCTGVV